MLFNLLWTLICGALIGWIAGILMGSKGGLLRNICVGIAGSALGSFLCSVIGIYAYGMIPSLIVDVAGACLLLWIIHRVF